MNLKFKILFFIIALSFIFNVPIADAQWLPGQPLVPCGVGDGPECTPCDLFRLGRNIIDFVLIGLTPPLATLFFIWAGFLYMTGGAAPGNLSQAKNLFWNTFLAVAVIMGSWLIVNTLMASLSPAGLFNNWWEITCTEGVGTVPVVTTSVSPGTTTQPPTTSGPPGTTTQPPTTGGITCPMTGVNLCQPVSGSCSNSSCSQYLPAVNQYASGVATANLLKAIMINESSCNATAVSPAGSYGLMQLQPATANQFKSQCGISSSTNITGQWLTSNPNLSICLAASYIRSLSSTCGNDPRHLAANYNGNNACGASISCAGDTSCGGGSVRRWECLYDNPQKTTCNTGYEETRNYAPKVLYCVNNPGF